MAICAGVKPALRCNTRAARPATWGVARLVPVALELPEVLRRTLSTPTTSGFTTALAELAAGWSQARLVEDRDVAAAFVTRAFAPAPDGRPIPLSVQGTNFQIRVWEALLRIPPGHVVSYHALARHLGKPTAARAVAGAVAANPVSFLIPCHRVIRQSGVVSGYRWGRVRKQAMLGWEAARYAEPLAVSA